jgi:predicted transcriptional regulator
MRILEVRKVLGLNQKEFLERIKVSQSYTGVLEAPNREINDRIIELVCGRGREDVQKEA